MRRICPANLRFATLGFGTKQPGPRILHNGFCKGVVTCCIVGVKKITAPVRAVFGWVLIFPEDNMRGVLRGAIGGECQGID